MGHPKTPPCPSLSHCLGFEELLSPNSSSAVSHFKPRYLAIDSHFYVLAQLSDLGRTFPTLEKTNLQSHQAYPIAVQRIPVAPHCLYNT